MDPESLNDEHLVAYVEWLSRRGDRDELEAALDELFARIRDDIRPGEREKTEKAIVRLRRIFTGQDDDEGPDVLGVREPRRPPPHAGDAAAALEPPDGQAA